MKKLIELEIMQHADDIMRISEMRLSMKLSLWECLQDVAQKWKNTDFEVKPYKDRKDFYMLGAVDDIMQQLDDSLVTISAITGSRYVTAIRDQVKSWQNKLLLLQATIEEWLSCQNWMYLESIFVALTFKSSCHRLPKSSRM